MNRENWSGILGIVLLITVLVSCGGGGGGSAPTQSPATGTQLSGSAVKGPINGAAITVYALNDAGAQGAVLATATTGADGKFAVNLGSYTGNILAVAAGGTYTDEATGAVVTNTATVRAAFAYASTMTVAVTPLTEIAVHRAGTLTTANIAAANALVSNMIGVDIITIQPANVLVSSSSTAAEKNYGLACAVLSQMVSSGTATSVAGAISQIEDDLSDGVLDATGANISAALTTFINSGNNQTGLTTATAAVVQAISNATPAASLAKAITAFGIVNPARIGTINENAKTIAVTVPHGTNVTALIATFTTTGASVKVGSTVQVSGTTPNDFTNPVAYVVTAADGTTATYTVTVTADTLKVDDVLISCPTLTAIQQIDHDLALDFSMDSTSGTFVCKASDGSADLTLLQKRTYNALLVMRDHLTFNTPLPWTSQPLYTWLTQAISGIRFRSDVQYSFCCDPPGIINIITGVAVAQIGDIYDRWPLTEGFVGLLVHEARHNEGYPHTCPNGIDDKTISELGSWGVDYYFERWLVDHLDDPSFFTTRTGDTFLPQLCGADAGPACYPDEAMRAANGICQARFCNDTCP